MNRRTFVKRLAGASAGLLVGSRLSPFLGFAQSSDGTPGVTPETITVGMSAALTGASAALGVEYYRGAQAYLSEANAAGGVYGRVVQINLKDDAYEPARTLTNTLEFLDEGVLCLFNYVGTPTLERALPLIKTYDADDLILLGNLTGAQVQREDPYVSQVYNVRPSYYQEMRVLTLGLWGAGVRSFGVFYQSDSFGRNGVDGVALALRERDAKIAAEATYRRGASFDTDMTLAAQHLRDAGVEAVLTTGSYAACGAFIRAARDIGWEVPVTNVSFVGADALLALLKEAGADGRYTRKLVVTQVVPNLTSTDIVLVQEYRAAMEKYNPALPEGLGGDYTPQLLSFVGLEGYINARVLVEGLKLTGLVPDRENFRDTMSNFNTEVGLGVSVNFTGTGNNALHQGLNTIYPTLVENGQWAALTDWAQVL